MKFDKLRPTFDRTVDTDVEPPSKISFWCSYLSSV